MSKLHDLIAKVENPSLRDALAAECRKLEKGRKFGLVFEEHLPEATPLYDLEIKPGMNVATRIQDGGALFIVKSIDDGVATCIAHKGGDEVQYPLDELVAVATFGEPIYPYLKKIDSIENGGGDLWHTLIEADNYHALQLLEYLYAGKVDCIYIDPPYNTGARDWKYNNDYVDSNDAWRHSKWLSMMEKRLKLAKKLLNPKDSVLIVTIDEKEYLHLGMLLEQLFPEARMQMVSSVINNGGTVRSSEFARTDEYLFFVMFGDIGPSNILLDKEWIGNVSNTTRSNLRWRELIRHGTNGTRRARPNLFYPIFVSQDGNKFMGAGEPLMETDNRANYVTPEGCVAIWPIHSDGSEGSWGYSRIGLIELQKKGFVRLGKFTDKGMVISFLQPGQQERLIESGADLSKRNEDGSVVVEENKMDMKFVPGTQWSISSHNASSNGSVLLQNIIGKRFSFPKSLYAVHDTLRFFVANNPNALILDFFAGSGTTLHAVNLLNAEDGGKRRCIMVTNNEVSDAESKMLREKGFCPGDEEWEKLGVARYVTWPRTVCSIQGRDIKGQTLKGDYGVEVDDYVVDEESTVVSKTTGKPIKNKIYKKTKRQMYPKLAEMQMSDGFKANAAFFKLGFLNPGAVALGRKFEELLPVLWMKAGAHGECPKYSPSDKERGYVVWPENKMAVLFDEGSFAKFAKEVRDTPQVETIFVVTDYEPSYRAVVEAFSKHQVFSLYGDYLTSFRVNVKRG